MAFLSAFGLLLKGIFKAVPIKVWLIGVPLVIATIGVWRWHENAKQKLVYDAVYAHAYAIHMSYHAKRLQAIADASMLEVESAAATEKVRTVYVDRIKLIESKAPVIIEKVPVYVTQENDAACTVNHGFVSLWNTTNQGEIPGAAGRADGSADAVTLSDIARQHVVESTICRRTEAQLIALQGWVSDQGRIYGGH